MLALSSWNGATPGAIVCTKPRPFPPLTVVRAELVVLEEREMEMKRLVEALVCSEMVPFKLNETSFKVHIFTTSDGKWK